MENRQEEAGCRFTAGTESSLQIPQFSPVDAIETDGDLIWFRGYDSGVSARVGWLGFTCGLVTAFKERQILPDSSVSPYTASDFHEVTELLARCLSADPMTPQLFSRKALLDVNFDVNGALVARVEGKILGFLLALARSRPLEDGPDDRKGGWITLFGVDSAGRRRGIGTALLEQGLDYLRSRGCTSVAVSPYAPNYWTPGVDAAAYAGAVSFLEKRGFRTVSGPISMDVSLSGWSVPEWVAEKDAALRSEGVIIQEFNPAIIPEVTAFLRAEFPGDWQRYVRETMLDITLGRREASDLIVCYENGQMVGFSQHEGERFGPFGVGNSQRGRGLGAVLLFGTLEIMRRKGHHNAWFMWTDDSTAERIYKSAGFRETRRYSVMTREL